MAFLCRRWDHFFSLRPALTSFSRASSNCARASLRVMCGASAYAAANTSSSTEGFSRLLPDSFRHLQRKLNCFVQRNFRLGRHGCTFLDVDEVNLQNNTLFLLYCQVSAPGGNFGRYTTSIPIGYFMFASLKKYLNRASNPSRT